jgi:hypothetical protein
MLIRPTATRKQGDAKMCDEFTNIEDAVCSPHGFIREHGYEAALRLALGAEDTELRAGVRSLLADTAGVITVEPSAHAPVTLRAVNKG